jgi:hypothetical protein
LAEFKDVVEDTGLEHRPLRGNFIAVARARGVEAPPSLKMTGEYRRMAAETLEDEWAGAKDSDLLVFNPAAWGGPHIARSSTSPHSPRSLHRCTRRRECSRVRSSQVGRSGRSIRCRTRS